MSIYTNSSKSIKIPSMVKGIIKSVKSVLFADPNLLYKEELGLIKQPFYFEGVNNKAVLLIHGWTSTPYEMRRLGKYLNENGWTVSIPMLRGHGTIPEDLENIKWNDWMEDAEKEYLKLKEKYNQVYVGGTSIGANVAVLLAQKYPGISGLVLMATPYKFKLEKMVNAYSRFMLWLGKKYSVKFYPPTFGIATTITRLIAYKSYPIRSALQAYELVKKSRENLGQAKQPCIMMQSSHDHMVVRKNMEKIYEQIGSKIKEKKYIHKAYHTFISDIKNEHVFEDILNFLGEN